MIIATQLYTAQAQLGECPRWSSTEKLLYWVDIARNELHRLDPATGINEMRVFPQPIGCFAFHRAGGLILAMKDGFAALENWGASLQPFGDAPLYGRSDLRFNDGRTDARGNFWVGSVNTAKSARDAALYRLSPDGRCVEIEGGMYTCNGAAFSADGSQFYHTDTPSHMLRSYDILEEKLLNRQIIHQFPLGQGRPDGGTFDMEGYYWTALFDGGRVVRLAPDGTIAAEVVLPVSRPTMIVFGGDDWRTAFVTSAQSGLDTDALSAQPQAGDIFSFRVDVPGVPEWSFG
jgi:sugar lactone lactonase YvrE